MLQNPLAEILPADQADLVLVMIISIPLSYLLSFIYNKYILLTLSMALTISFQSLLFPSEKWFLWGQQQIVYLIVILAPRKYVGHIIIVESFLVLTLVQLRRLYMTYGDNHVDITGIFMMQLFNYVGLGYNYQNGGRPEEALTPEQRQRKVVDKPSYITYMGYVNFLPACLVGPVYEYADFDNYLHRRGDYVSIPSTLSAMLREGGVFLLSLGIYFGTAYFHIDRTVTEEFNEYSFFYKMVYILICITHIELKYVSAWSLGMMSMRASGITYNPSKNIINKDNSVTNDFGRVETTGMMKFYFDPSLKVKADHWNMSMQAALRKYVYENLFNPADFTDERKRRKRQFQAQLATVIVSALWHGIYPGYYISFVHWVIYMQIPLEIFRLRRIEGSKVQRFYKKYEGYLNFVENIISHIVLTYFGMPFHLMTFDRFWTYARYTYFIPYIVLYAAFYLVVVAKVLSDKKGGKAKTNEGKAKTVEGEVKAVKEEAKNGETKKEN